MGSSGPIAQYALSQLCGLENIPCPLGSVSKFGEWQRMWQSVAGCLTPIWDVQSPVSLKGLKNNFFGCFSC